MAKVRKTFSFESEESRNIVNALLKEACSKTGLSESRIIEYLIWTGLDEIFREEAKPSKEILASMQNTYRIINAIYDIE